MNRDRLRLTDAQFSKIEPHLPTDTRGKASVVDRRVISDVVHVLMSGGRWVDTRPSAAPGRRSAAAPREGRRRAFEMFFHYLATLGACDEISTHSAADSLRAVSP